MPLACFLNGLSNPTSRHKKKPPIKGGFFLWRRVRDSNPRSLAGHEISSFAPSTTRTTLQLTSVLYQQVTEKSRLFRQLHHSAHVFHNAVVILFPVRAQAAGAILNTLLRIAEIASALISQCIQRAIAKQAAEILRILALVAREILAFCILKEFIIFHIWLFPPLQIGSILI